MNRLIEHRGFSLIELLLAIFILGIGVISIATLFPAGIAQQQKTTHDILGPIIARNAMTILRSRLEQEDFGGVEAFDSRWQYDFSGISMCETGNNGLSINPWPTICGDWMWYRPAIVPNDYGSNDDPFSVAVRGAIDIFASPQTEIIVDEGPAIVELFPVMDHLPEFVPPGIPYNKDRYPDILDKDGDPRSFAINMPWDTESDPSGPQPVIRIFAGERQYPMWNGDPAYRPEADYYWDCMFRRYEGRILVAIFVYRVVDSSQRGVFTVDTTGLSTPDFPRHVDLTNPDQSSTGSWNAKRGSEIISVAKGEDPTVDVNQWQYPGQWIVDQNGNVHNVQRGRRRPNDDVRVRLSGRPIELPRANVNWWIEGSDPPEVGQGFADQGVVTDIWFVPTKDSIGRRLIPVYATVQEL